MHAAHNFFNIDTLCSIPLVDTLNPCFHFCLFFFSLTLPFVVFVWLLVFVCLLFPDGRRRLHLSGFQVPREIFTALAQALILFPLAGLYDGPFIHSNWKQLSLPVWVRGNRRKPRESLSLSVHSPSEHRHWWQSNWFTDEDSVSPPNPPSMKLIGFIE